MPAHFRIGVRFLHGEFHGRGDGGEPEWPPSPLRLFQALTNAAARLGGNGLGEQSAAALRWLEVLRQAPEILASKVTRANGYQLYVPDNVGDLVAKAWCRGNEDASIANFRAAKQVRPLRLSDDAVHYLWLLNATEAASLSPHREALLTIARATARLGWGVDMVVADAALEERQEFVIPLSTERWLPSETLGGSLLRVPVAGTLDDLNARHAAFLSRLQRTADDSQFFRPVPPLENFRVVTYRREAELAQPPYAVFALRRLDDSAFAAFDPQWRRLHLAGMLRHVASQPDFASALGWDQKRINAFILGHDSSAPNQTKPTANAPRLVFIPLPSREWRGDKRGNSIGAIRRVLVTVSGHFASSEFQRIIRALEGRELIDEKTKAPAAFLRRQTEKDDAIEGYIDESATWTTVTPVVLPGHDDPRKLRHRLRDTSPPLTAAEKEQIIQKLDARIDRLLRKAFRDAGLPAALIADADLEWRGSAFLPGAELASRYSVPDQCRRFRRLHVRVTWRERTTNGQFQTIKIAGPLCIGSGRFSGLGLFVPTE